MADENEDEKDNAEEEVEDIEVSELDVTTEGFVREK